MLTFDKLSRIELEEASEFLIHRLPFINSVDLVIQLGSGQSPEGLLDSEWDRVPLRDMPNIPAEESLARHNLEIIWGTSGTFKVLIFAGRFHLYEGHGRVPCILPIWAAAACGARNFLFTNAAVAINNSLDVGDFMVFRDHINNLGVSALSGHQHLLETAYVDMSETYSSDIVSSFFDAAKHENMPIKDGVYMAFTGPQYETPAELDFARMIGADAVGMSTVLEATTAHALKARVLGVSMIVNSIQRDKSRKISHEEALEIGKRGNKKLTDSIRHWLVNGAQSTL